MSIIIKSLSKSYGNNEVLKNIELTFKKGTISGVVGKNGSGKTTLFKCIAGLEDYNGNIGYDNGILKNKLGFLPTNPYFLSKITGFEYLQLLCNARNINIDINDKNLFDLPLNQYAETYSTGMKKKLALTGLLIQNNEIYILDEPFNGVDIQSSIIITELLIHLKKLNKIIILSSHVFSILTDTCDNLYYLKENKIIKTADRSSFYTIENEIKKDIILNNIDKMGLT